MHFSSLASFALLQRLWMDNTMLRLPHSRPSRRARVSVVIPCYNYERYVEASIQSALAQRDVDVDVTVVDDASTDDSAHVVAQICERDTRVRLTRHATNLGHLKTANEAIQSATGEFVVKLDADDLLTPGSLARSAVLLLSHPDVGFAYGYASDFQGEPPQIEDRAAGYWKLRQGDEWLRRVLRRAHNVITQPEIMIRREALHEIGKAYDERLPWAEDYHLWLRLAARWNVGYVGGCVQGLYRVHSQSIMRSAKDLHLSDLRARVDATRLFLESSPEISRRYSHLALSALARDTRILLASRREDNETPAATIAEYRRISLELEKMSGMRPSYAPATWDGTIGRTFRTLREKVRWRRWRLTGV